MSTDIFDELCALEVPPPPATIARDVHERVNHALTVGQLCDFALRGAAYAAFHLLAAIAGGLFLTLTGKFPAARKARSEESNS